MKKTRAICLIMCLMLLFQGVLSVNAENTDATVGGACRTVDASVALGGSEQLVETSTAVMVYERSSGILVYSYNPDEVIYPASMVKMMTALVALENGNLSDVVTVTRSALDSVAIGSVSAGLVKDEELTLEDLLYCMMVASANDAAAVIAEHIAGSQYAFIELMNEKAAELGCTNTHFSNVHGLHDEQTYTTVRDICRIIDAGLDDPVFKAMFEAETYTVEATNKSDARSIVTTNNMMSKLETSKYYDERVTGGKTGATNQAGRCLAVTAQINDMELIAIVMGAKATYEVAGLVLSRFGSFEEMGELLDYVEDTFEYRQIFQQNQVISQHAVSGGSNYVATTPVQTLYCVLPKEADVSQLTWSYGSELNSLSAPIAKEQVLSTLQVWYGGICIAETDLVAMNGVDVYVPFSEPDGNDDEVQEEEHGAIIAVILGVLLGIAVLIVVAMTVVGMIQKAAVKARVRRRRRNRRRNRNA